MSRLFKKNQIHCLRAISDALDIPYKLLRTCRRSAMNLSVTWLGTRWSQECRWLQSREFIHKALSD